MERLLAEPPGGVIDFGAGHSVYKNDAQFSRVAAALAPYPHVVLLLPSPDHDESLQIIHERAGYSPWPNRIGLAAHFLSHPSNQRLAKHTVYTGKATPAETAQEILDLIAH